MQLRKKWIGMITWCVLLLTGTFCVHAEHITGEGDETQICQAALEAIENGQYEDTYELLTGISSCPEAAEILSRFGVRYQARIAMDRKQDD